MKSRILFAVMVLGVVMFSTAQPTFAQDDSGATIQAHYRDMRAIVYDKVRGVYGVDYSYDWNTNNYTTYSSPHPSSDFASPNVVVLDGESNEAIWKGIEPVTVDLEATHPWGGAIKRVSVRAANNGTWIFMAFEWNDTTESLAESPRIKRPEGGFFYNSTHFYSDNLFMGWWMKDGQPTVKPWFNAHYAGTTLGRVPWRLEDPTAKASLWLYKAYIVDDDSRYWPLHYTSPRTFRWGAHVGQPLAHPYSHMYQTLLNSTANYLIGSGIAHVSGCAFPEKGLTYPWDVRANGKWENGVWTLEVARPFNPHPQNEPLDATMTFKDGETYRVFYGAADGNHGENEDVGSISQWLTLSIEPRPSPSIPIWIPLVVGVALVVGVVGVLVKRRRVGARIAAAKTA